MDYRILGGRSRRSTTSRPSSNDATCARSRTIPVNMSPGFLATTRSGPVTRARSNADWDECYALASRERFRRPSPTAVSSSSAVAKAAAAPRLASVQSNRLDEVVLITC